ncbi:MAG: hypothetical protein WC457_00070 [Patescibacteria group bacterium]
MIIRNFWLQFIVVVIIIVLSCLGYYYFNKKTFATDKNNDQYSVEKTIFDGVLILPESSVVFNYPKAGFYGFGSKITTSTSDGDVLSELHIEPLAGFNTNMQSAYVVFDLKLSKNKDDYQNLDDFKTAYLSDSNPLTFEKEYAGENGKIITVNDVKYFIYQVKEDATVWRAFTLIKEGVIEASLSYTGGGPIEASDYDNDKLFLEVLENIKY